MKCGLERGKPVNHGLFDNQGKSSIKTHFWRNIMVTETHVGMFAVESTSLFPEEHKATRYGFKPEYPHKYSGKLRDSGGEAIGMVFVYLREKPVGINVRVKNAFLEEPTCLTQRKP